MDQMTGISETRKQHIIKKAFDRINASAGITLIYFPLYWVMDQKEDFK